MATKYFDSSDAFIGYFNSAEGRKDIKTYLTRLKASKTGVVGARSASGSEFSIANDRDTPEEIMIKEANRLRDLILKHMANFLALKYWGKNSYDRTGKLADSVRDVDPESIVYIDKGSKQTIKIDINFIEENIMHESILNEWYPGEYENEYQGDAYALIRYGWEVKQDVWFKNVRNFGHFDGYDFIKKAVDEFNSNNPNKIRVTLSERFDK